MKQPLLLTVFLVGLCIAGCSSTPTRVDKGPVKARTFSFVNGGVAPRATFADSREEVHRVIQEAITQDLAGKGLSKTMAGGDVIVAYLVVLGNNASTEAINTYFGYNRDASALRDKAHEAYTSSKNPNYFEAGTLLIDIIDARTYELLKRNYVVRPILRDPSAEVRAARIQEAVGDALKDLRVAK